MMEGLKMTGKPDLLIFLSDQHHAHYAGYAGHPLVRTPHLDRLAEEGCVFEAAYTACPLCVPARTAFLTGRLPSDTGVYTNGGAIAEDQATFIHSIAAEGYDTVLCGRMHFMGEDQRHGFTKRIMGEMTPLFWGRGGRKRADLGPYAGTLSPDRCLEVIGGGTSPVLEYDRAVVRAALDYLDRPHEKPQCLVVGTYGPHFSYVAPPELFRYYRERVTAPEHNRQPANYAQPLPGRRRRTVDEATMLDARAAYLGMIEQLDSQVGEVRAKWQDYLRRSGRAGVFLYLSDHGDQAGEHGFYGKETFHEGSAKIPLVVQGDGLLRGRRFRGAVSMLDVGVTLGELIGATLPPEPYGRSLLPQLREGKDDEQRAVISEFMEEGEAGHAGDAGGGVRGAGGGAEGADGAPGRMVRKGTWKYITYFGHEEQDVLFDLQTDPYEQTDVSGRYPDVKRELRAVALQDWNPVEQIRRHRLQLRHLQLLGRWGANTDVAETERWPVPEHARALPER